jgi:general secretion pathway protein D
MGAAVEKVAEPKLITMNFQDVEINVLAKFISEITGKNFIIDEKVRGKVTVISPTKITPEAAYLMFQSVLQVKGFTIVPSGAVIKIVPTREAKQTGLPTLSPGSATPVGDGFVTRLVPLQHVDARDMATVLRPMVSQDGLVVPYTPTNNLILTDAASNLQRLLGMIEELDVEGREQTTEVIPLKYAFAEDLAKKIEEFLPGQGNYAQPATGANPGRPTPSPTVVSGSAPPLRVLPDERTNSLIVAAGPIELKAAKKLISQLDVPLAPGTSRVNVYYLKNANAEEMLPVLGDLIGARTAGSQQDGVHRGYKPGGRSRSSYNRQGQMGRSAATPSAAPAPSQVAGSAPEFASEVRITADPATNALLISASPQDFATLKKVISKLDVRRRQVYVEAIILEVSLDRARQLGIELQGEFSINSQGVGLGRVNLRDLNTALTNPASLSGLLLAAASNSMVELPDGSKVPAKIALLRAAQVSADINVLSAPNILTTDNQEAEILVGQNIPFIASRATDTSQLENLFATVERQDVGITLRLIPQISEGDVVRLDIYQEVSAIVPTTVGDPNLVGPTISVRSASTTVVVKDKQTVVIGGLISDNTIRRKDKVPYLGDIPVLGNLFQFRDDRTNKINLLIFLTPHIIRNETEMATLASGERDRFKQFLREHRAPPRWQEQLERPSFASPPKEKD